MNNGQVKFSTLVAAAVVTTTLVSSMAQAQIRYVDDDAAPGGNGLTWETAFNDLQNALSLAADIDSGVSELWVAAGLYVPSNLIDPTEPRSATFELLSGVSLYGGFAGGETSVDQRDIAANPTILSGDLNGDDGPDFMHDDDNCYHVVKALLIENAALDGFIITGGNARADATGFLDELRGGGVYVAASTAVLRNCAIQGNSAFAKGGGMYVTQGDVTLSNCRFSSNRGFRDPPNNVEGGGLHARHSTVTLTDCQFDWEQHNQQQSGRWRRRVLVSYGYHVDRMCGYREYFRFLRRGDVH